MQITGITQQKLQDLRIGVKTPEVGAIFQTAAGPYGHVGVVESVNPNGTITVSEMNYAGFNVKSYNNFKSRKI